MEAPVSGFTNAPVNSTFSRSRMAVPSLSKKTVSTWLTVQTPWASNEPQSKYAASTSLLQV